MPRKSTSASPAVSSPAAPSPAATSPATALPSVSVAASSPGPAAAPVHAGALSGLLDDVLALRGRVLEEAGGLIGRFAGPATADDPGVVNLAHYLAVRHHDLRDLQRRLMRHGLSSLGRMEGRVLPTLDAVAFALAALAGRPAPVEEPTEAAFFAGETALAVHTEALLGAPRPHRRGRIMVTLPGEAADDGALADRLVAAGMDVARINCAHDDPDAWRRMAGHVRAAATRSGRAVPILMDIAGPKIRTGAVAVHDKGRLVPGSNLVLIAEGTPEAGKHEPFVAAVSLPEIVRRLSVGDRVRYDDGKVEAVVEAVSEDRARLHVLRAKTGGAKLKPEKGLNLPDTALGLSPLTDKDAADLEAVIAIADMIGYSFVSHAADIDLLEDMLAARNASAKPLGLIAKIERPEAVANLPALIARAAGRRPFGVMIARGDLAAEIGFERLAEMQEEILWICEAARVPAIWATQVLEDLVKDGVPSRGEMTDAAMAARAECVMLNKGPEVVAAVELLDRLIGRMGDHFTKKTPTLRALKSW